MNARSAVAERSCRLPGQGWSTLAALLLCILGLPAITRGQAPSTSPTQLTRIPITELARSTPVGFANEVLPILRKNCLACHKGREPEGELNLETAEAIRRGGASGAVVVPGQGGVSRLLLLAAHEREPAMPPADNKVAAGPLTSDELGLLKLWIDQGASGGAATKPAPVARQPLAAGLNPIMAMALAGDDNYLAVTRGPRLQIVDLRGPHLAAELVDPAVQTAGSPVAHDDLIRSLAFDPSGQLLASGGLRTVKLWRRPQNSIARQFAVQGQPTALATSRDGKTLALGTLAGAIELHDLVGDQPVRTLIGSNASVTALAFAADGARLYSAGSDKTLRSWDVASGAALGTLSSIAEPLALCLVAGDTLLAAGEADNSIHLYATRSLQAAAAKTADAPAGEQAAATLPRELKGHSHRVTSLATVGLSGEQLLSGSADGQVRLWNVASGETVRQFGHDSPVAAVAVNSDTHRAASVGPKAVRLWNLDDAASIAEIKIDPQAALTARRADGRWFYAKASVEYRKEEHREAQETLKRETAALDEANKAKTTAEKSVSDKTEVARKAVEVRTAAQAKLDEATTALRDAAAKRTQAQAALEAASAAVKLAATSYERAQKLVEQDKDNASLAAEKAAAEKTLTEAREKKQAAETSVASVTSAHRDVERKHDEARRTASDAKDKAKGPERELEEAKAMLQGAINFIVTATVVAERAKAAVPVAAEAISKSEQHAAQCEQEKKRLEEAAKTSLKPTFAATLSPDGRVLACAGDTGVQLYDALRGTPLATLADLRLAGPTASVKLLAFAGPGKLVTIDGANQVHLWSTPHKWTLQRTIGHLDDLTTFADRVLCLDFNPAAQQLVTGGGLPAHSGELKIWNVADGKLLADLPEAHRDTVFAARFSPDGKLLATGSADRTIKIFRTADWTQVGVLEGHTHHVLGVAWSSDGRTLASCGGDQVIKFWTVDVLTPLRTLRGDTYQLGEYKRAVTSLAFVGDTEHLVASGGDRSVRLHRTTSTRDVRAFREGQSFMQAAAATSDGKLVIGGGRDGVLHIWHGESGYVLKSLPPQDVDAAREAVAKPSAK